MRTKKAIFFDVDSTLYQYKDLWIHAVPLIVKHSKMMLSYSKVRRFLHKKINSELDTDNGKKFLDDQADWQAILRGKNESRDRLLNWRREFIVEFDQLFTKIGPSPHLVECLETCRHLGLKMGLLTDLPLCKKIERLGLDSYDWQVRMCSEDFGVLKPNKSLFIKAAEMIGVDLEAIIFVGDSYVYDICGANSVGMKTAHYTKKKIANSKADFTFSDYRILIEKLKQWT